jgi:hypothetical protein
LTLHGFEDVDARHEAGHDESEIARVGIIFENLRKIIGSFWKRSSHRSSVSKMESMWAATSPCCVARNGVQGVSGGMVFAIQK